MLSTRRSGGSSYILISQSDVRACSQRRSESCVSPEFRPAKRLSTLMSSSRSGQWIPKPPPMRRQLACSAGVPRASRGNQASGTAIVRASARSTTRDSSRTITHRANACLGSVTEILMPCPRQQGSVFANLNSAKLSAPKVDASLQSYRIEKELRLAFLPLHVNVARQRLRCTRGKPARYIRK